MKRVAVILACAVTWAAGLLVGIPTMAFFAVFRGRTSALVSRLEAASNELLTALIRKNAR